MKDKTKITIEKMKCEHHIEVTHISPSDFDIRIDNIEKMRDRDIHITWNFTDYGQTIKSYRVERPYENHDEYCDDNIAGWEVFDTLSFWIFGPPHEGRYKVMPASIARLCLWRFWANAEEKAGLRKGLNV